MGLSFPKPVINVLMELGLPKNTEKQRNPCNHYVSKPKLQVSKSQIGSVPNIVITTNFERGAVIIPRITDEETKG